MRRILRGFARYRIAIGWSCLGLTLVSLLVYQFWWKPERTARQTSWQHFAASAAALREGDEAKVESELIAAITAWPANGEAYSRLGEFYSRHNQQELSGTAFLRLLQIAPHFPHVYCRLAQVANDDDAEQDTRRYAKQELKLDPRCVRAHVILALLEMKHQDYREAHLEAEEAYHLAPKDPKAVITYAQSFLQDNPIRAAQVLAAAQKLLPQSWEVAFDLGFCHAHGSSSPATMAKALLELRQAEKLDPEQPGVHRELCRLLMHLQRLPDAATEGERAVHTGPYDPQGFLLYSQVLERLGQHDKAAGVEARFRVLDEAQSSRQTLQTQHGTFPDDPEIAHQVAQADIKLGLEHEAVTVLETALSLHPEDKKLRQDLADLLRSGVTP